MFKSILVPTDFTPKNKKAIEIAINFGNIFGSKVTLLHVIETIEGASLDEFKDFYEKLYNKAEKELDKLVERYGDDVVMEKAIVYGKRAVEIVKFAQLHMVDLIVMASHRLDLEKKDPQFGTISYKVGLMATCPILLVK